MRYAVYFTPPQSDPLTIKARTWLGRDAFNGQPASAPAVGGLSKAEIASITAFPRRYGFHATIVAPFRLSDSVSEQGLLDAFDAFCAEQEPFAIPRLAIGKIDSFFALIPDQPVAQLDQLARNAVEFFNPFRAPLSEAEIARRNPEKLSERERGYLRQYGYPHVMEEFRFHMTLTGPVAAEANAPIQAALQGAFGSILSGTVHVGGLAIFVEPSSGGDFIVHTYSRLGATGVRKSA